MRVASAAAARARDDPSLRFFGEIIALGLVPRDNSRPETIHYQLFRTSRSDAPLIAFPL